MTHLAYTAGVVEFVSVTQTVSEDVGSITLEVQRTGSTSGAIQVEYETQNGSAFSPGDYTSTTGTLNWSDGESGIKSFSITIIDDSLVEQTEVFTCKLKNAIDVTLGANAVAVISIDDNDNAGIIQFSFTNQSIAEDVGNLIITAERIDGDDGIVSVEYETVGISAFSPTDYASSTGTLEWADGESGTQSFSVPIVDDMLPEGTELFTCLLTNVSGGAALGNNIITTILINDNPAGVIEFEADNYFIDEGAGQVIISVSRNAGSVGAASVSYETTDFSAFELEDYLMTSGTLNWMNGESGSQTFSVPLIDDIIIEPQESFLSTLTNVSGASEGNVQSTSIIIEDNDDPSTLQFTLSNTSVNEADGTIQLTVTRTGSSSGDVSVDYATSNGSAVSGLDFISTSGTLSWVNGETSAKSFLVPIIDDTILDPAEMFTCNLSGYDGPAMAGTNSTVNITIDDNEELSFLQFASTIDLVNEGDSSIEIFVTRTGGSTGAVSVEFDTVDGSAVSGSDYVATSGTLNWANGDTSPESFQVPILDNNLIEALESFTIQLSNYGGTSFPGTNSEMSIDIEDNDNLSLIQFATTSSDVNEGDGSIEIFVTRTGSASGAVSVQYNTAIGSAVAGSDYSTSSGTLNWGNGDMAPQSFMVPIIDDLIIEASEQFSCQLSTYGGPAIMGSNNQTSITIIDNDGTLDCTNAIFLQCSDVVNVNTVGLGEYLLGDCVFSGSATFNNTVWYQVLGTGEELTISTCASATDYSQEIHVYTGECSSLTCFTGDDNDCMGSNLAEVSFNSVSGIVYTVMVGSFGAGSVGGDLTVELICGDCPDRGDIILNSPNDFGTGDMYHFETNTTITAQNDITSGAVIDYDGLIHILLEQDFEVEQGAVFHAYTTGCGN